MRTLAAVACICLTPFLTQQMSAQQTPRRAIRATADASVAVRPDAARVTISVVKQAATAADAASQNAAHAAAVIAAVRQILGANADVKTSFYSLAPLYSSPRDGTPATIVGFTATNSIEAVTSDPGSAGRVIDTAIAAGATRVDGVRLFLRDDETSRAQALRLASQRARNRAEAIALGLGVRLGQILYAQEGSGAVSFVRNDRIGGNGLTAATPIEPGSLEVRATVTVDVEVAP